ncbi:hypothetical protein H4R34_000819 [Dimargaris verticillata]|uniref:Uncharacterized protein n=1 Tax=Dimargaris verticillata TaxID=2761393 RepID=A0A9W8B9M6_9FUNG|nr:hypothetical protein H4R34_000819 [Dimargaris verticillata]
MGAQLPSSTLGRGAVVWVTVIALICVVLEVVVLDDSVSQGLTVQETSFQYIYNIIYIFAELFIAIAWWSAVVTQNVIQTFAAVALAFLTIVYAAIGLYHHHLLIEVINLAEDLPKRFECHTEAIEFGLIGLSAVSSIVMLVCACLLYKEFAWSFYRRLGADIGIRRMNLHHLTFTTLLQLNLFFYVCYSAQILTSVIHDQSVPNLLRMVMTLPISLVILFAGYHGLVKERRGWMWAFMVGMAFVLGFMVLELVIIAKTHDVRVDDPYTNTRNYKYFFGGLIAVLTIMSAGFAVRCYLNFDQGLKEARLNSCDQRSSLPAMADSQWPQTLQHLGTPYAQQGSCSVGRVMIE